MEDKESLNKELVTLVIEKTLLNAGRETYDKVIEKLKNEYRCELSDCYRNPNYLSQVLKGGYGSDANIIVESIKKELRKFKQEQNIAKFLDVICQ
jgi:hypothetical protein